MATSSPWKDIDDKFCVCSICLEQLKEPKQLPCLHRYCENCLRSIIRRSHGAIKCPECREEIQIPTNGVDGFKTDFYSKSLVEYVQIQQSLKTDEILECYGCSKHLRAEAYCFKCNDFLCKECHKFHLTSKMMKDHRKHNLSLEDIEAKNITVEKLASMRDAPRCHTHPGKISELFCETCNNAPVCMACTYGEHIGHILHEVNTLAKLKREELAQKLKTLEVIEKDKKSFTPGQAKRKLMLNANIEKEKVIKIHDENDQKIVTEIHYIEGTLREVKREKQEKEKKIFDSLQRDMDQEIQDIKKKYDDIFKLKKSELSKRFNCRECSLEKQLSKLRDKHERFHHDKKELLEWIEKQLNENLKTIKTISEHCDNIKRRYETLNVMALSILASENDWSAVHCIPDMCTAATNLMEDFKKDFPDLSTLTEVVINYKKYFRVKPSVTRISDVVVKEIYVSDPDRHVIGMTSSGDGNIVISGYSLKSTKESFIIVIDMIGRVLKEKKLISTIRRPWRYCKFLSQYKVASVCEPNEIGLYDVRDGSYIKKTISDIINSWPQYRCQMCLATDPANNHILVGRRGSRDVYVFDDHLNYLHIMTLPEMIKRPLDMTVSDGHLLVCVYGGKKYYVIVMDRLENKLVGQFKEPDLGEDNYEPISVCTDENDFVYILWKSYGLIIQCHLVQYNQDGSKILTTRKVDKDAQVITMVESSQREKLLVATENTQPVYLYDIIQEERQFVRLFLI